MPSPEPSSATISSRVRSATRWAAIDTMVGRMRTDSLNAGFTTDRSRPVRSLSAPALEGFVGHGADGTEPVGGSASADQVRSSVARAALTRAPASRRQEADGPRCEDQVRARSSCSSTDRFGRPVRPSVRTTSATGRSVPSARKSPYEAEALPAIRPSSIGRSGSRSNQTIEPSTALRSITSARARTSDEPDRRAASRGQIRSRPAVRTRRRPAAGGRCRSEAVGLRCRAWWRRRNGGTTPRRVLRRTMGLVARRPTNGDGRGRVERSHVVGDPVEPCIDDLGAAGPAVVEVRLVLQVPHRDRLVPGQGTDHLGQVVSVVSPACDRVVAGTVEKGQDDGDAAVGGEIEEALDCVDVDRWPIGCRR